ncbi:MAG: heparan-alpha-glucosaminide N-acetyltransferase [Arcticibacterium sp.]|jgi:heparan-alpha-glucosaminide N-acetyltransferase
MENNKRILSIDIMRGLTLFLMLFVNDLYTRGVPKWLVHTAATEDGMGLADWVFPGFLFMVGLSIPFAFSARSKSNKELILHILERTVSLLIIGIFMVNAGAVNAELTGISKTLWIVSGYIAVFLIWNKYPKGSKLVYLKYAGILLLIILAFIYRGGTLENPTRIEKGWWGILGLIGWGYFSAAFTYLFFRDHIWKVTLAWLVFLGLNILSYLGLTDVLNPLKPIFGIVLDGNVPLIVISGLIIGILLKKYRTESTLFLRQTIPIGFGALIMALVLHHWFIISKIEATPSWGLLCTGISILLFALLFYLIDVKKKSAFFAPFKPAGENSLSTYLAPDIVYYLFWALPFQVLFYKQDESSLLAVGGSIVWAFAMIGFAALLAKINIRLKL